MNQLPLGTVTFLFTDIEGSTQLWEKHPQAMKTALARHDSILKEVIESNSGHIIKTTGDGVHAVFTTAMDGISAAVAAQRNLQNLFLNDELGSHSAEKNAQPDPAPNAQVKVRMGLHSGEAELRANDYYGQALNRAARLMAVAHGGQILVSNATAELLYEQLPANTSLVDLGEHRLKDLVRPEHIFQLSNPSVELNFPPLRTLDAFPNNLPIQLTSFIGRERELAEAKSRLASARLLTLIGPGGTGKTRLSLQLAADVMPVYADGVWWVELAALSDPDLILQSIASVFGLHQQMGMSWGEQVINYLRAKQLLLILDNCEHLIDAGAKLTDELLHACPRIKVIISSREALGIGGETIFRVPSLTLPDETSLTRDLLAACESAQLFMERALAVNPKFDLTDGNAPSIAQICRRLDGIPLALELAAARITVFSPEEIAARLGDRFKLLTGGSRTALPRQQTLRAMIDWSYDMLTEPERALLRKLSVFAGGWTFEAAESMCAELDVLSLLTQLVNKSLVVVDEDSADTRYHLLETIRQYAREKLLGQGESEQARDAHLVFFLGLAEALEPKIDGPETTYWIPRLDVEFDNFRTALEWALENNVEGALRLVIGLHAFWFMRGHEVEGCSWAGEALDKAAHLPDLEGEAGRSQMQRIAGAWLARAKLAFNLGDNALVIEACQKCLTFARALSDTRFISLALTFEMFAKIYSGDAHWVRTAAEEIRAAARASEDNYVIGLAMVVSGEAKAVIERDFKIGYAYAREGLDLLHQSGNRWGLSMGIIGLGMTAKFLGDYTEARSQFTTCLPLFREIGDEHRVNMCKSELAHIERYEGHYERAGAIYRETIPVWQKLGHRSAIAHQLECLAMIARAGEKNRRAARLFGAAEALREQIRISMTAEERVEYNRETGDLRSRMEDKSFDHAWAEGRAMTMEAAIALALA